MALAEWKKEVEVSTGTDADQDLLLKVLSLDRHALENKWTGDITYLRKKGHCPYPNVVTIKGTIVGTPIVLKIGNHDSALWLKRSRPDEVRDVQITSGGGWCPTPDELHMIAMLCQEGRQVLANARKKYEEDCAKRA